MSKQFARIIVYIFITIAGSFCGCYISDHGVNKKKDNYVHPYDDYSRASLVGDTILYKKIVVDRMAKTPSHPDFLDLSIKMVGKFNYTPGYYNIYIAIKYLYNNNNLEMGNNVKRMMYSYLQLAIESKDYRITKKDLTNYYSEYPEGISINKR